MVSLDSIFTAIANAIRSKTGGTEKYIPEQMAEAIENLSSGSSETGSSESGSNDIIEQLAGRTLDVLDFGNATEIQPYAFQSIGAKKVVGNKVKSIGNHAFSYVSDNNGNPKSILEEIVFPNVATIGYDAFNNNDSLVKADISSKDLTLIPADCFYNCNNLKEIALSDSIIEISDSAFTECNKLVLDSFPINLQKIGEKAFYDCESITVSKFPSGLTSIGAYAFQNCSKVSFSELPESVTKLGAYAFYQCQNITISKFKNNRLAPTEGLFCGCQKIKKFELPDSVLNLSIPRDMFNGCSGLEEVVISDNCVSIGNSAFYGCTSLKTIRLSNNIKQLVYRCFGKSAIEKISLPPKLISIDDYIFFDCSSLTLVKFHSVPETFSSYAFQDCSALKDIYVPWSEGTVSGAPWSASNATIHYDTVYATSRIEMPTNTRIIIGMTSFDCSSKLLKKYDEDGCPTTSDPGPIAWSLSDTSVATIDPSSGVLTILNPSAGDTVTVTATSERLGTFSSVISFIDKFITVNGHDGEWIDSGTQIDGNIVYKSDKNSYKLSNGISKATINFCGYTKIVVYIRSYAESSYDYTEAAPLDTNATRNMRNSVQTTRSRQSSTQYYKAEYSVPADCEEHFIEIIYSKDSSSDRNDDRGYFYISSSESE